MFGKRTFPFLILFFVMTGISAQVENYGEKDPRDLPPDREERTSGSDEQYRKDEKDKFDYNSTNDGKKWDWANARIGGNFGLAFERGGIFLETSPTFGYKINHIVELGAGFKMFFYKDDAVPLVDASSGVVYDFIPYKSLTYGPIGYGRFSIWEGIFAMAQYEMVNKEPYYIDNPNDRINVHHLLIGGGYSVTVGGTGNLNISLLYNVLDNRESIYQFGTFGNFPLLLNISMGFGFSGRNR